MNKKQRLYPALICMAAALACTTTWAQLGKPTAEELARRGKGSAPDAARSGTNGESAPAQRKTLQPSTDPRDFSGFWRPGGGGGGGGTGIAGGPRQPGRLPDRVLCLPQPGTWVGVDGPLMLAQTPEQITWAAEMMHTIRRIYLTGKPSANLTPSYYGEALGHWDGNTLIIETRGMKSLPAGAIMIERWTKSADGRTIVMKSVDMDSSGKPLGAERTSKLTFRGDEEVLEWMCEDYNDEWLPGGAGYSDQINVQPVQRKAKS
jgi:hypothetical protein